MKTFKEFIKEAASFAASPEQHYLHHAREYHNALDSIDKAKTPKQETSREAKSHKHYAEIKKHHGAKLADALYHLPNSERERISAYKNY